MPMSSLRTRLANMRVDNPVTRLRRGAIATSAMDPDSEEEFNLKVYKKTDEECSQIMKGLESSPIFSKLEDKLRNDIISALEPTSVGTQELVIEQGAPGDYFYVIKSGQYAVSKKKEEDTKKGTVISEAGTPQSSRRRQSLQVRASASGAAEAGKVMLAVLNAPACFGELALMYSAPRSCSVRALVPGELWRVNREVFRGVLFRSASATQLRFLRQVPVLSQATENMVSKIHADITEVRVAPGDEIPPNAFNIIYEGKVAVSSTIENVKNRPVLAGAKEGSDSTVLEKFAFFGDLELMSGASQSYTYKAQTEVKLMMLSKSAFEAHLDVLRPQLQDLLAFNVLRSIPLLKDVKSLQLMTVLEQFKETRVYKPGETIVQAGIMGQHLYIALQGNMEVVVGGKSVVVLPPHTFVGEQSLLSDDMTGAAVVAKTECFLYALARDDFNTMLGPLKEIIAKEFKKKVIRQVSMLDVLSDKEVEELALACTLVRYNDGETIIEEGEVGETFYIMKSGEVVVTQKGNKLRTLPAGSFFGERALMDDEPRGASITAVGVVECFVIDREDFTKHLGSMQDLMKTYNQRLESAKSEKLLKLEELETIGMLGSGAFGLVSLVKDKLHSGRTYALKAINKAFVHEMKMSHSIMREVQVLKLVNHPMLMRLVRTFADKNRLYMLMDPLMGGELFVHLGNFERFPTPMTVFYSACVLLGLNAMHNMGLIYRDLKLENLLLDNKGYLKIVDFGFAKNLKEGELAYTLCGTPDYLAPEIIKGTGHDKGCDLWSLGILIYEMLHGYTPFASDDDAQIFTGVLSSEVQFESDISPAARDLILKLLNRDPKTRIGNGKFGIKPIMAHPFFKGLKWDALEKGELVAPFFPNISAEDDTSNFDEVNYELHDRHNVPFDDPQLDAVFSQEF